MKKYAIVKSDLELPELTGMVFDPEEDEYCEKVEYAAIDSYVWGGQGYKPEARAYVTWDERGLKVLLCAFENEINVEATEFNGPVYKDSCLEFFVQPFEDDPRYLNFETNAGGVALIGFGANRHERIRLPEMPEGMEIQASRHRGGWWAVAYRIPAELFRKLYGRVPAPGSRMRGNFYKCDESIHPHFGSWAPIVHFQPDFHRPEWFGELTLETVSEL